MGSSVSTNPNSTTTTTGGTTESAYDEAYDAAKDGAEENTAAETSGTEGASTTEDPTEPAPSTETPEDTDTSYDDSTETTYNYGSDGELETAPETDTSSYEAGDATEEYSRREELQQWMEKLQGATRDGKDALKNGDAPAMETAVADALEVLSVAEEQVDQAKQEEKSDQETKKEQAKYLQLMQQSSAQLKSWRGEIGKAKWTGMAAQEAKNFAKTQAEKIQEALRGKADRDTQRMNKRTEEKHSLWTELCKGAKSTLDKKAPGHEKKARLSKEEIDEIAKEAFEDGFDGIAGFKDLRPGDRKAIHKSVKQMKAEVAQEESNKAKEAETTQNAEGAEVCEEAAEAQSEVATLKAPDQQHMKTVVASLRDAGKLTKEAAENLLKDLAERAVMAMKKGAGILASRSDAEERTSNFGDLLLENEGVDAVDADEGGQESVSEKPMSFLGFKGIRFRERVQERLQGMQKGNLRLNTEGSRVIGMADASYSKGSAEDGIREHNAAMGRGDVFEPTQDLHTASWESQKGNDIIIAARLQAVDPEAVV